MSRSLADGTVATNAVSSRIAKSFGEITPFIPAQKNQRAANLPRADFRDVGRVQASYGDATITERSMATPSPLTQPKTFTLAGKELLCYQAGEQIGMSRALTAAAARQQQITAHIAQQMEELQRAILEDRTYPMLNDHPVKPAVLTLTTLVEPLRQHAADLNAQIQLRQQQGSKMMGEVAMMETAQEVRWRPPVRAWGMLALALIPAVTVATVGATLAARSGWW